jgi:hypothetical protein
MPGDKLLSNKQLILGKLNMQTASPPFEKKFYYAVFEMQLLTWTAPYAGELIFCQKTTEIG